MFFVINLVGFWKNVESDENIYHEGKDLFLDFQLIRHNTFQRNVIQIILFISE